MRAPTRARKTQRREADVRGARALAAVALLLLGLAGCGSDEDAETPHLQQGTVQVTSRDRVPVEVSTSAPIQLGKNDLTVVFPANTSAELVGVGALMPAHGHGTRSPGIMRDGDRFHVDDLVLYMKGRWELRFARRHAGHDDEALVTVDVP